MNPLTYFNIEAALGAAIRNLPLQVPFSYNNKELADTPETLWGIGRNTIVNDIPITLGDCGENEIIGFFQIDLNILKNKGVGEISKGLGVIANAFAQGTNLVYNSTTITLQSTVPTPARYVGGYFRQGLTINYTVRYFRATIIN